MTSYIRTFSGHKFPTNPKPSDVRLQDIATALSRVPRFAGHTAYPYSVAAHCIHVSCMVPRQFQLQALFHDASEAYICDIPSPFKRLMPEYKKIETRIMEVVAARFCFTFPIAPEVKQADHAALYLERKALFKTPIGGDFEALSACGLLFKFLDWVGISPETTANRFTQAYKLYAHED